MKKPKRVSAFREALSTVEEAKSKNNIKKVKIKNIQDPPFHDRTNVSEADIWNLANNMKEIGLINPVILRKKDNGNYERISGYRRIEAAKKLGWKEIDAIVIDVDEKTALLIMLSENIQREDLNPYDEVVSLLQLISINLNMDEKQIKSFLYKIKNYLSGNIKELSKEEKEMKEVIDTILSKTGKYNFQGFINRLRVLNLHPLLIEAMRTKRLPYSHAVELNKIKDEKLLKKLIKETLEKRLSKEELIKKVKALRGTEIKANPFKEVSKKLKYFHKLPAEKQALIEQKIREIQEILEQ